MQRISLVWLMILAVGCREKPTDSQFSGPIIQPHWNNQSEPGVAIPGQTPVETEDSYSNATRANLSGQTENQQMNKRFVHLSLPRRPEFCPIVVSSTASQTIVASVFEVDEIRDIHVLLGDGESWEHLGARGGGLTGADRTFLADARLGPDGRLWVLASYSTPSNRERGDRDFIYCYSDGSWTQRGPATGHAPRAWDWDTGLHFWGGPDPVHLFSTKRQVFLLKLDNDSWVPVPAQEALRRVAPTQGWPTICRRDGDTWMFWCQPQAESVLYAFRIKGIQETDVEGPFRLESWDRPVAVSCAAVSLDGTIGVIGGDIDERYFGRWYRRDREGNFTAEAMPVPVGFWADTDRSSALGWSPKGKLYAAWRPERDLQRLRLASLGTTGWTTELEAGQPTGEGLIHAVHLSFRQDGTPIVVWESFFRK